MKNFLEGNGLCERSGSRMLRTHWFLRVLGGLEGLGECK